MAKGELAKLAENWSWSGNNLKLAGIGTPRSIIDYVMEKAEYVPYVPVGSIRKNKVTLSNDIDFEELQAKAQGDNFEDITLFDEENQRVLVLAGELLIENVSPTTLQNVEKKLEIVAKELLQAWNQRQNKTDLQKTTLKAFGSIHDISDPDNDMLGLLQMVIESLPSEQSDTFDADSCHEGFLNWNEHWKKFALTYNQDLPITNVHHAYQSWIKRSDGKFKEFQELWESCMIRGTSEAVCETVGSIMKIHAGRNRHLQPNYFSMEIVLRWNLGPLHLLKTLVDDVYNREKKIYIRKCEIVNKIVSKDLFKSSACDSFEKKSEEKSKFPASVWLNSDTESNKNPDKNSDKKSVKKSVKKPAKKSVKKSNQKVLQKIGQKVQKK